MYLFFKQARYWWKHHIYKEKYTLGWSVFYVFWGYSIKIDTRWKNNKNNNIIVKDIKLQKENISNIIWILWLFHKFMEPKFHKFI